MPGRAPLPTLWQMATFSLVRFRQLEPELLPAARCLPLLSASVPKDLRKGRERGGVLQAVGPT